MAQLDKEVQMKLEETGPGVYLMGRDWEEGLIRPKEALAKLSGILWNKKAECDLAFFIGFSVRHNAWCGVSEMQLFQEARGKDYTIDFTTKWMLSDGMLEIRRTCAAWYLRWLSIFGIKIICPSRKTSGENPE